MATLIIHEIFFMEEGVSIFLNSNLSGATQRVYDYLREGIVTGVLAPGSPISEMEISKTLQVSRSPVREAIMALEGEGMVHRYPNRGCFVNDITAQDVNEIFELRSLLEVAALNAAFRHIDPQELDRLEADLLQLKPTDTADAYFETDRRLHSIIISSCGNMRLVQILRTLNSQIEQVRRISASQPKRLLASRQEHLTIVGDIKAGDLEAAREAMSLHIQNVRDSTLKACIQIGLANSSAF